MERRAVCRSSVVAVAVGVSVAGGCAVGPDFKRPEAPAPTSWTISNDPRLATQAATDQINKAAGTSAAKQGEHKAKKAKDDNEPNYGRSEEHRQDGEHGHKGKHKGQD